MAMAVAAAVRSRPIVVETSEQSKQIKFIVKSCGSDGYQQFTMIYPKTQLQSALKICICKTVKQVTIRN